MESSNSVIIASGAHPYDNVTEHFPLSQYWFFVMCARVKTWYMDVHGVGSSMP